MKNLLWGIRGNDSITFGFFRCPGICAIAMVSFSCLKFLIFANSTIAKGSGYRTTCRFLHLKPYSTAFCNMTVTHDESAVGLVETK